MIVYKLFRKKKCGDITSLFINKTKILPINVWLNAEEHPTPGYKFRPYWHCIEKPIAPHLSKKDRIWLKVEIDNFIELNRPTYQGGKWFLAKKIKILY
jgi:hypothetical protein